MSQFYKTYLKETHSRLDFFSENLSTLFLPNSRVFQVYVLTVQYYWASKMDISDIHAAWRIWMYMTNLAALGNHGFSHHMRWYSAQTHSIECSGWTFSSSPLSFWSLVVPSPKRLFQAVPPKFNHSVQVFWKRNMCIYIWKKCAYVYIYTLYVN